MGAGEYYLEELEEIICMEEERRRRQKLGLPTDNGALQDSVSELFSPKNSSGYRKQTLRTERVILFYKIDDRELMNHDIFNFMWNVNIH